MNSAEINAALVLVWERAESDDTQPLDRAVLLLAYEAINAMQDRCLHLAREIETQGGEGL